MSWTKFFFVLNIILLISLWLFTILSQFQLPEIVPTHFDLQGNPDDFGDKNSNWLMPIIATMNYVLLQHVAKETDSPLLNVPNSLRKDKKLVELFVQVLTTFLLVLFLTIQIGSYFVAMGFESRLGYSVLIEIILMFVVMVGFFIYAKKKNKTFTES